MAVALALVLSSCGCQPWNYNKISQQQNAPTNGPAQLPNNALPNNALPNEGGPMNGTSPYASAYSRDHSAANPNFPFSQYAKTAYSKNSTSVSIPESGPFATEMKELSKHRDKNPQLYDSLVELIANPSIPERLKRQQIALFRHTHHVPSDDAYANVPPTIVPLGPPPAREMRATFPPPQSHVSVSVPVSPTRSKKFRSSDLADDDEAPQRIASDARSNRRSKSPARSGDVRLAGHSESMGTIERGTKLSRHHVTDDDTETNDDARLLPNVTDVKPVPPDADGGNADSKQASAESGKEESDGESATYREQLQAAIELREKEIRESNLRGDAAARAELELRLLYTLANETRDALRPIESLDDAQQDFWKNQLHALIVAMDPAGKHSAERRAALALRPLRQAVENLSDLSPLDLRNASFCTEVENFGRYREFGRSEFRPGQEVLIYVEVGNLAAEERSGKFETELLGNYEIRDPRGERVAQSTLPTDKQDSRNRRHDYFIAYPIFMPAEITPGQYSLVLTLEDVKGKKSSQATMNFRIKK